MTAAARQAPSNVVPLRRAAEPREAHRASVSIHYPNIDTYEMEVRCELMELRDRSAVALNRCCKEAEPTLLEANRLASLLALSSQTPARLTMATLAIRSLIQAATLLQRARKL